MKWPWKKEGKSYVAEFGNYKLEATWQSHSQCKFRASKGPWSIDGFRPTIPRAKKAAEVHAENHFKASKKEDSNANQSTARGTDAG